VCHAPSACREKVLSSPARPASASRRRRTLPNFNLARYARSGKTRLQPFLTGTLTQSGVGIAPPGVNGPIPSGTPDSTALPPLCEHLFPIHQVPRFIGSGKITTSTHPQEGRGALYSSTRLVCDSDTNQNQVLQPDFVQRRCQPRPGLGIAIVTAISHSAQFIRLRPTEANPAVSKSCALPRAHGRRAHKEQDLSPPRPTSR
jgi:hypothetical protein